MLSPLRRRAAPPPPAEGLDPRIAAELERAGRRVAEVAAGDGPVVVGPFTGEVGFELLYWIPFVRWAVATRPELAGRLVVVSRGGTASWYGGLASGYVDLYDHYEPDVLAGRAGVKQREVDSFDASVLELVSRQLGSGAALLHPSLLYALYYRVTKLAPDAFVRALRNWAGRLEGLAAVYEPFAPPEAAEVAGVLPEDYVAVRFYFRPSFPDTSANRALARELLGRLAAHAPVVLLDNRMELDDHREFLDVDSVVSIAQLMRPATNLHVQTAAIAGARAFVGTYGGLSYLAPHLGVPSLAFASVFGHVQPWHRSLAETVFDRPAFGPLVSLRPRDLDVVGLVGP